MGFWLSLSAIMRRNNKKLDLNIIMIPQSPLKLCEIVLVITSWTNDNYVYGTIRSYYDNLFVKCLLFYIHVILENGKNLIKTSPMYDSWQLEFLSIWILTNLRHSMANYLLLLFSIPIFSFCISLTFVIPLKQNWQLLVTETRPRNLILLSCH